MDISRLKSLAAHESGDKVLEEFFRENEGENPILFWKKRVQESEIKIKDLENLLASLDNQSGVQMNQEWLEKEKNYLERIETLEKMNSQNMDVTESDAISSLEIKTGTEMFSFK